MVLHLRTISGAFESLPLSAPANKTGITEPQKTNSPEIKFDELLFSKITQENLEKYNANPMPYVQQMSKKVIYDVQEKLGNRKFLNKVEEGELAKKVKDFLPEAIRKEIKSPLGIIITDLINEIIRTKLYSDFIEARAKEFFKDHSQTSQTNMLPPVDQNSTMRITQSAAQHGLRGYASKSVVPEQPKAIKKTGKEEKKEEETAYSESEMIKKAYKNAPGDQNKPKNEYGYA